MAEYPALPLWTDAYLADTRHLSTLEHGAYLLLLMEAWRRPACSLPDNDTLLARLAGLSEEDWAGVKPTVMSFWKYDGRSKEWQQKRLLKERVFVKKHSQSQSDRALKRWDKTKKDHAAAMPDTMPDECPDDAPTPIKKERKKEAEELRGDGPEPDAPAEPPDRPTGKVYAFKGRVVRLDQGDFDRWCEAHAGGDPALLRSWLTQRDDWLSTEADEATRKRWYITTSNVLAKKATDLATSGGMPPIPGFLRRNGNLTVEQYLAMTPEDRRLRLSSEHRVAMNQKLTDEQRATLESAARSHLEQGAR